MARFDAATGRSFQLDIVGYQFGQPKYEYVEDDNWLVIEIKVVAGSQRWRAREPALMTWELAGLIKWLREVSAGATQPGQFDATEPNLSFTAVRDKGNVRLTALFRLEFAHPRGDYDHRLLGDTVEFLLSAEALSRFTDELDAEGAKFPLRSPPA